ncbi:MAG: carboxypeptidase-like regulatory domain-containing protein, partial [Pseudomonadales bacterium]|nr:carboxypeptidase-like regulatory domain-containing protein [Pseudomonadales bacterium]
MNVIITAGIILLSILALPASAGTLTGKVVNHEGKSLEGVLIRVTDDARGVSESVYTNPQGQFTLATQLHGTLKLRARTPYFKDTKTTLELAPNGTSQENLVMTPMTDPAEISDSLPAAYHFGSLPFESGDDKDFNRYQFQRDCLSCHQMGNPFTRLVRTAESWSGTIERMHQMVGNFDAVLRDRRSVILAKGFDGKPISVRPEFP